MSYYWEAVPAKAAFAISYNDLFETLSKSYRPIFYVATTIWIVALFYATYSVADKHFTWALKHLAKFFKMSPDLAGMTLLAFGNGAPDFFTAVFGATEEPEMILGASVGSGLFIVTVVFGLVLFFAKPPSKKPILPSAEGAVLTNSLNDDNVKDGFCKVVTHKISPMPFLRSTLMYLLCVIFLWIFALVKVIPFWLPLILLGIYLIYMGAAISLHVKSRNRSNSRPSTMITDEGEDAQILSEREKLIAKFHEMNIFEKFIWALKVTLWDEKFSDSKLEAILGLILIIVKAPVNFILNVTILPIEIPEDSTDLDNFTALRFLHRLRCIVNPFFSFLLYLTLLGPDLEEITWPFWVGYGCSSMIASIFLFMTTFWDRPPKLFAIHIFYAFCTSVLWIYAVCNELVSCLSITARILRISPTVIGILVLAWGNSFGDLVADVSIAKNGDLETAITAIFSGPVQNVLLTIGVSFLGAALRSGGLHTTIRSLKFDIYFALGTLALVVIGSIIAVSLIYKFNLPRNFGFLLLAVYMAYLPVAIILGLGIINSPIW